MERRRGGVLGGVSSLAARRWALRVPAATAVTLNEWNQFAAGSLCPTRRGERFGNKAGHASVLQAASCLFEEAAVAVFIRALGPPPDAILALERGPAVFLIILPLTCGIHLTACESETAKQLAKKASTSVLQHISSAAIPSSKAERAADRSKATHSQN